MKSMPARGPRRDLCVVVVTMSAVVKGLSASPGWGRGCGVKDGVEVGVKARVGLGVESEVGVKGEGALRLAWWGERDGVEDWGLGVRVGVRVEG